MLMNTYESRLKALREELAKRGLDGFVVPISDEHMSEYVGGYAQRLAWLTGFGGSAGTAVVLTDAGREPAAAMFVDGRYTLQVREQVDGRYYAYESVPKSSIGAWLAKNAPEGARIGFDPWLHGMRWAKTVGKALEKRGGELVAVDGNPIDAIWEGQPAPSPAKAQVHETELAGQSSESKSAELADWLKEEGLDAAVIPALDSVAWLLNIRGLDIDRTPVALANVIAHADGTAELFIAEEKVSPELRAHLGNAVRIEDQGAFSRALSALGGKRVALDPGSTVAAIFEVLDKAGAQVVETADPCALPKAQKNPVELQGHRDAQARDGVAVSRFLHWLSVEAPGGEVTELAAADRLQEFRKECGDLRDLSFDTISGAGPNAAIPHYRVTEESSRTLEPGSVYLCDSGGQYPDGTTDITRTVWIAGEGEAALPPAEVRDRFTRVLKGHIALALVVFPENTSGGQLDAIARQFLWQAGLDYAHGTGHGVGSYLSVHEGPQRIAKPAGGQAGTEQDLLPGMILSNEPGYYKSGEYGIRVENLQAVEPREIAGAEGEFYGFETLTLVPLDRRMVEPSLLTPEEKDWWNAYHAQVREVIGPQLEGEALAWFEEQCEPL